MSKIISFSVDQSFIETVNEAKRNQCGIKVVKDHGIYFISDAGDIENGKRKNICYADGFDPETNDFNEWWDRSNYICGGDDFCIPINRDIFETATEFKRLQLRFTKKNVYAQIEN